ncbi:bifunctional proline dehydrogenase/L-glutamate gamma-semialdehyde dehydrogenase [Micrococcus sp. EYE_162]|uniref:bifunctional proline dehydrogenase/L-glutamate gamma-semialdehyde dehydrogenase n=1 Tax=unclassified Micrococcus TaxID=2620948 RepID=UPI0020031B27|nr:MULTISPECIES: bifunctional proline dehydrogenase/L-glutamate gamma-semialdehyde dehydrogenase [unclassified Micrococcus]MCK6095294.1 bifunctional proline dehydrogenase/L-glutamate gamma-semialdehyde dehydrogenase [Micrococcus sp. EYE_212]MCK6171434.1 bifunctional proline dehydrogenase/L-glutamate gamma-semialdehyde dehydrogenase [Micrococcus sp. EYE_162]
MEESRAAAAHETDALLKATGGIPDPADLQGLADEAVEQVRAWLEDARGHEADFAAQQLAAALKEPGGLDFIVRFVDHVIRPEDPAIAARALRELAQQRPGFLPPALRAVFDVGGRAAPLVPRIAVPVARRVLRQMVSHLIVDARDKQLGKALETLRDEDTRLNINLLGEAILGKGEADRRLEGIAELIRRDDVDYVSVKVSAATAPHAPYAYDEAVEDITARLTPLYELAREKRTFVNLDMEEYHDLDLTLDVFMGLLEKPQLRDYEAGIVLQAYLPDALGAMIRLQEWSARRVASGGAPIKVRVVKGANLPMEQMQASLMGWPLATVASKQEADTNYKRVLNFAFTPEHLANVRIGVAGHNLFDVALAHRLMERRGLPKDAVEFEMLLGMATGQAAAVKRSVGSLLLYTPVVKPSEFDVAISYLVRRLEEGASHENFMSAVFDLDADPALFDRERERFLASLRRLDTAVPRPARGQDRSRGVDGETPAPVDGFANTPDTDPSLPGNRAWARQILEAIPRSTLGTDTAREHAATSAEQARAAIAATEEPGARWGALTGHQRADALDAVGRALHAGRARLLEVAASETGKTLDQGDPEVSEAVDFAHYYARLARGLDEVEGARAVPVRLTLVIPPWNFPVAIPVGGVLAALGAGSPVVFKPAPQSERTGAVAWELIVQGLRDSGLFEGDGALAGVDPADLVRLVTMADEDEEEVGTALVTDPAVERLILTGGYETATLFKGMRPDLHLLAETSGKNALIVTPSADLDLATRDVVTSAFGHAGQKCSAASLVILVGSVGSSERFRRQLLDAASSIHVAHPDDPRAQMGPVIEEPGEKLRRGLTELGEGESWALEPRSLDDTGRLFSPGVRANVRPGADAHLTEYFGPVLSVMTAATLEEAVELANAVDFGLTSGLHSLDPEEIDYWLTHIQAGNLYVNRGITGAIVRRQPFGGWKRSVVGPTTKAGGPHYLRGLVDWEDVPTWLTSPESSSTETAEGTAGGVDPSWLQTARKLDEKAWTTVFGADRDISALVAERNVLRHVPTPVLVRWASGPAEHLLRVVSAGLRAGAPLTVSLNHVPSTEPGSAADLSAAAVRGQVEELARSVRKDHAEGGVTPVAVVVEDAAAFHERARRMAEVPATAEGGGDARIRLVADWTGDRDGAVAARAALNEALGDSPDVAVYAGPVVSAGEVELLPFLHEQAVSVTAHRFGTPDHLTDEVL